MKTMSPKIIQSIDINFLTSLSKYLFFPIQPNHSVSFYSQLTRILFNWYCAAVKWIATSVPRNNCNFSNSDVLFLFSVVGKRMLIRMTVALAYYWPLWCHQSGDDEVSVKASTAVEENRKSSFFLLSRESFIDMTWK